MRNTVAPVCLVDDDASVREAVESLIRSAGLKAIAFESAQEFLAGSRPAASRRQPLLIIWEVVIVFLRCRPPKA